MGKLSFGKGHSRSESDVVKIELDAETDLDRVGRRVSRLSANSIPSALNANWRKIFQNIGAIKTTIWPRQ